ncbi:phosphodiester glycosidase family protein [Alistipes shahii]|jgi:Exopolysaccharide biosynthesis protein related to N-acetylglucosamine-1-phosphodiester alpha-N-acetylglucosaminidase|uniref:phosphodiester glycosidase family protein n=1 Tax=Alistipes shahii TaxID=328814 RepID=UPI00242C6DD9|nr:phosphodiester glycosidase family protein [Alistipes shahii]MCI7592282.1 phosphodiester glycosidase family protein [Alistipes shahii]
MKTYRYMIGMLLCVWLLAACDNSNAFDEYAKFDTTAQTAWGQSIVDGSNGYVAHVKSDRTYNLADGVDVLEMAFLADDGLAMQLFLFKIALSDKITLRTTLADDKDAVGTGQTIMKQLEAMRKNGRKVLGGTNADFFNTTTFIPYGVCWRDGVCVKSSFSREDCNVFVISTDNEAFCLTTEEYAQFKADGKIREAVCGRSTLLLKNGEQLDQSGNTMPVAKMEPRTAIGVSQDGKEVYLMVVDGRNFYYSNGADLLDLMNLMSACGASDALNLDGGGSSTFIARDGAEGELKLLNWPTDQGGVMRKVATGLAIVEQ